MTFTDTFAAKVTSSLTLLTVVTLFTYTMYAAVFGLCALPSIRLIVWAHARWYPFAVFRFRNYFMFSFSAGLALFLFYIFSVMVLGILMRLTSLGIKPGRYSYRTFTVIRWLFHSGFYGMAATMVLPMIRVTIFVNLFYRLVGCRIGKNTRINTTSLIDSYLLTIGDGVIIGGETMITCHLFENNHLILKEVKIGDNTLVGARSYIPPGVSIGKNCIVGIYSYLRKDTVIPDGSKMTSIASLPFSRAREIERGLERFYVKKEPAGKLEDPAKK